MPAEQTASSVKSQDAIALLIADHKKVQKMFKDFEKLEQRMGVLQLRPCISSRQKSRGCGEVAAGRQQADHGLILNAGRRKNTCFARSQSP